MSGASSRNNRPRVTLALFAYNQARFIREALTGALAQEYDNLEIILSDDCSADRTFAIMEEEARTYGGPHEIRINRNRENLGLAQHVNHVLAMAEGEIIVFAAGDDISLPGRVRDTVEVFAQNPAASAVSFTDVAMDADGTPLSSCQPGRAKRCIGRDEYLAAGGLAQRKLGLSGASRAIRRQVFELFGDLNPDSPSEDNPYLLRSLWLGDVVVCGWAGIRYRIHEGQLSSERSIVGMDPKLFRAQYMQDLGVAVRMRLVSHTEAQRIRTHIGARELAFTLRKLRFHNASPDFRTLIRVAISRDYSWREKAGLFRRFILRKGA